MNLFEVALYNESPDAVARTFCADLEKAKGYIEAQLKVQSSGIYTATIWGPKVFLCYYMNDRGELFSSTDPWILTRAQAAKLRTRGIDDK